MFDFKPFENVKDFIFLQYRLLRHHGLQHCVVNTP